ncbi:porin family protein [Olivibacter sp. CPCC 100613]|uniref:porin family protein n=1 Tax=Olivibacter sp. CPCC 100613 TaxID=3079931 RepID=UPI002FF5DFEA
MKKVLMFVFTVFVAQVVFAQQEMGFGIKAGVNFPKYNFSGDDGPNFETGSATNFHVTAFLDAPIAEDWFYVQPGISLQGKGAKITDNGDYKYKQSTMWIEIPVNFVAKFPTATAGSFFIGAGPYVAFGISGKNKWEDGGRTVEQDIDDFEFGSDGALKSTDFGLNFIGGFEFSNGLMIHGGYGMGLTNLSTNLADQAQQGRDYKQTNRVWTVGLGFRI